jgi:hypothetical protein
MKRKTVLAVTAFLLILQAQTVFAADTYRDFNNAIEEGNFSRAERILKNNANKWSIKDQENCWGVLHYSKVNNSTALRAAQLLYQYRVSFGDETITRLFWYNNNSEELCRYLLSIGMPIGDYAITYAITKGHTDNFVQLLLEKGGTVNQQTLQQAAKNRRWALLPDLINKSTEDNINYRLTREEYTTWYNSQSATGKQYAFPYDPSESKTALMFAAQYGQLRIVRLLMEKGARVNLRADDGATAASLAYDNGEVDIYDYLKANGARDFEPRQVVQQPAQPAAPAQSTTNVYVQPSAPAQPAPANRAPATPVLRQGRYACSGTNITMDISTSIKLVTIYNGYTAVGNGSYTINDNSLAISILRITDEFSYMRGVTYEYTITSDTSFTDGRERWVRTGS